jgi:Carboxypeptidase regulatory-like domain
MRTLAVVFVLGVSLVAAAPSLAQQGTAELVGKVTDSQGAVLPGVAVVVTNEDTGVYRELVTGPEGSYSVSHVVPGRYRISAQLSGFRSLNRRGIVLAVGVTTTLDLILEVGELAETVTVTAESPLVDVTSAEIGGHISSEEITDLPAGNRSYMAFVGTVPGAQFVPTTGFLNDTMLANGQPAAANNVMFDGAGNVDDLRGSNVGGQARTANEAIQEVQVLTNQFDAEFGRASGAVINAVTKSGTNQLRGSVFDFFTGRAVTAKDYFTRVNGLEKPQVAKQEWGGTIGGPVLKNKLHFFASVERLVQNRNQSKTYPTRPEFSFSSTDDVSAWNTLWRIDHQVTANNNWAFRWLRESAPQFNVLDGARDTPESNDDETDLDQTLVGTWTTVMSNTRVNTVRAGLTKEQTTHANERVRALQPEYAKCTVCPNQMIADQALLPPILGYLSMNAQADDTMDFSLDDSYTLEDTFSWFIPDKMGRHDTKFGARFTYVWISNPNNSNANGTYNFPGDQTFNPAIPGTYPERFSIRVPGALDYDLRSRVWELYAQDKWSPRNGLSLSLGIRYDLEIIPIKEDPGNPLLTDPSKYPVDKNNFAPRLGFIWNPDGKGRSVVRGGYGIFYDRTLLGTVDNFLFDTKYSKTFTAQYPQNAADPGPAAGRLPTDPLLALTTTVNTLTPEVRAMINRDYPPGSARRNTGTVTWDDPDREQPYFHQISVGYEREIRPGLAASADYVRMLGRDLFLNPNLNIGTRVNTSRTGRIDFLDPYGILNPSLAAAEASYVSVVRLLTTKYGYSNYDALNLSVEKRYAHNWSVRAAYALSYSRGVTANQTDTPQLQVGTDLRLDDYYGPANVDRRHSVVVSGRMEIPKTHGVTLSGVLRMLSGQPFTIHDTNIDADQNGVLFDPLPAGTYSGTSPDSLQNVEYKGGRNGARGPGFMQLDLRGGYRAKLGGHRTLDVFVDVFNVTNHTNFANFTNNATDRRNSADFLRLTSLVATSGLPRQAQLGLRLGF